MCCIDIEVSTAVDRSAECDRCGPPVLVELIVSKHAFSLADCLLTPKSTHKWHY